MDENTTNTIINELTELLQGATNIETERITVTVDIPVSLLNICKAICKDFGMSGLEDQVLANMVKTGLLNHMSSINEEANQLFSASSPPSPQPEKAQEPEMPSEVNDFLKQSGLNGLDNLLTKIGELGERMEKLQEITNGPSRKNNK